MTKANISGIFKLLEQKAKGEIYNKEKVIVSLELQISGTYPQIFAKNYMLKLIPAGFPSHKYPTAQVSCWVTSVFHLFS